MLLLPLTDVYGKSGNGMRDKLLTLYMLLLPLTEMYGKSGNGMRNKLVFVTDTVHAPAAID